MIIQESCSFCGKSKDQVECLLKKDSRRIYICNECVEELYECLSEQDSAVKSDASEPDKTPSQIKAFLDDYVIGQEKAKVTLSVAAYNHYKRIRNNLSSNHSDVDIQKSNILMLGPTGTGKTYMVQSIAKCLDVPFAIADATALTEAGYVGEDVESILLRLLENAKYDVAAAEKGIIYIDEIDKLSRKSENMSTTRDVGGEGVQQSLLKLIEGTVANVPPNGGRKHPDAAYIKIDTSNILFICGGAFDGIEKIIGNKESGRGIGFMANVDLSNDGQAKYSEIQPQDIVKYGLMPEFIGRLPVITTLESLKEDDLLRILTEPKNALVKQYKQLMSMDNVTLEFTENALRSMAKLAIQRNIGARGLRAIMEKSMEQVMFTIPDMDNVAKVIVDGDVVNGSGEAKITKRRRKTA